MFPQDHNQDCGSGVVLNCSSQFRGESLNQRLIPGLTLGPPLLAVLLRFREHLVAISSNIRETPPRRQTTLPRPVEELAKR